MTRVEQTVCSLKEESSSNALMLCNICKSLNIEDRAPNHKRPREKIEDKQKMEINLQDETRSGEISLLGQGDTINR